MALRGIGGDWGGLSNALVLNCGSGGRGTHGTARRYPWCHRRPGQNDFSRHGLNLVDWRDLHKPGSIATDLSALPNRLYVANTGTAECWVGET